MEEWAFNTSPRIFIASSLKALSTNFKEVRAEVQRIQSTSECKLPISLMLTEMQSKERFREQMVDFNSSPLIHPKLKNERDKSWTQNLQQFSLKGRLHNQGGEDIASNKCCKCPHCFLWNFLCF